MRRLSASMTINISYRKKTPIVIRRFPSQFEIEELEQLPYKLVDEERTTFDNEISINIYQRSEESFVKVISGGRWNFNEINPPGINVDITLKHSDSILRSDINQIARELCKKHMKPPVIFLGRYSVNCIINDFELSDRIIKGFLRDFIKELEKRVGRYGIKWKEPEKRVGQYDIKRKILIGILILITCGSLILVVDSILGIF